MPLSKKPLKKQFSGSIKDICSIESKWGKKESIKMKGLRMKRIVSGVFFLAGILPALLWPANSQLTANNRLLADDPNAAMIVAHCEKIVKTQCPVCKIVRIEKIEQQDEKKTTYRCVYSGFLGKNNESSFITVIDNKQ
ncbi:TPA: hypothetical protein DDZ86_04140 [Candidatus Dependentiae bacterium]|nr:hypothetical protein [Candidatus Dependentiae bacterium]